MFIQRLVSQPHCRKHIFACCATVLSLAATTTGNCQSTIDWVNPLGGAYEVRSNWAVAVVPGALDTARFNLDSTYSVNFPSTTRNVQDLVVSDGSVTFATSPIFGQPVYAIADDATISSSELTLSSGARQLNVQIGDLLDVSGGGILRITTGSDLDSDELSLGGGGRIDVEGEGSTFDLLGTFLVRIGASGAGTLNIARGGSLSTAAFTLIGQSASTTGAVNVSGLGSTWTYTGSDCDPDCRGIAVGSAFGAGTLSIVNGGRVIGMGSELDESYIGFTLGANGTVTVSGAGSAWTNSGYLYVGYEASEGTLTIEGGGGVSSNWGIIGYLAGATGEVNVTGANSTWTVADSLLVGAGHSGRLTIEAGGSVSNATGIIGGISGASAATVRGPGSNWGNGLLVVGGSGGTATLDILQGGVVTSNQARITGAAGQAPAAVTVSGAGSTWANAAGFDVGRDGAGTLTTEAGGNVMAGTSASIAASIGQPNFTSGAVVVRGAGSTFGVSGPLYVGGGAAAAGGTGTLTIESGGMANIAATTKIWNNGTVNLNGGTLNTGALEFAGSAFNFTAGTLNITSSQTIDSLFVDKVFGETHTILPPQRLLVGFATLTAVLRLDGGMLTVGDIANGSLLDFRSGTLTLTNAHLSIGTVGQFGRSITLGMRQTFNVSNQTLIDLGAVLVVGDGGTFTTGMLRNQGDVVLGGPTALLATTANTLNNEGLIRGTGQINGALVNSSSGEVRVETGGTITFFGTSANNSGDIRLLGGVVDFRGPLVNAAAGRITGRGALITRAGLVNRGHVAFSNGITDVYGDVSNDTGNAAVGITASGNIEDVTFWGDVSNTSGLFQVSAGSSATFFGTFSGNGISGGGDVFFEADITPGSSPGMAAFGGNVHFGMGASLQIELGGLTQGSQFDVLDIRGEAALDGALEVLLINGLAPVLGNSFEILRADGGIFGAFADTSLPALAAGLDWNIIYSNFAVVLQVAAIGILGDYNQNGTVDAADYVIWRKTLGQMGAGLPADGNGNGEIDAGDYNLWRTNFGRTASGATAGPASSAAVPEPHAIVLLLPVWCASCGRRLQRDSPGMGR